MEKWAWHSGDDKKTEADLEHIVTWVKNWRMKVNFFPKTQTVLDQQTEIKMAETLLKRNRKPKLLGVILDEKLTFQDHVKSVEVKVQKNAISFKNTWKDREDWFRQHGEIVQEHRYSTAGIFKTSMANRSVWSSWQSAKEGSRSTSYSRLGSLGGRSRNITTWPHERIGGSQGVWENLRKTRYPVYKASTARVGTYEENSYERYISLMGKMKTQMADMCTNAGITCYSIEPEHSYQESLQPTIRRPEYWNNLGSSKNRTKAQEEESRKLIEGG